MKKLFILLLLVPLLFSCKQYEQPELGTRSVSIIKKGGLEFKDLNKNGKLDKYEDWRLSPEKRAADLLSQMDIDEKVGFMIISQINMGPQGYALIPCGAGLSY